MIKCLHADVSDQFPDWPACGDDCPQQGAFLYKMVDQWRHPRPVCIDLQHFYAKKETPSY